METYTKKFALGLCSISFRSHSIEQIIDAVKEAGLECIEWGSDVHAKPDDTEALEKINSYQKQKGIFCSSYGTYFKVGVDPVCDIRKYIAAAKTLNTDVIRIWCGNKGSADCSETEREQIINECKELSKIAESEKVYLCLECHINTLTDDIDSAKDLMQKVDNPHFCMYWQPNQFKTAEENILYAKFASDITKSIHVFNWEGKNKYPLAQAKDVWKKYLECFKQGVLLLEFMPDNDILTLKREADALKEIAGECI